MSEVQRRIDLMINHMQDFLDGNDISKIDEGKFREEINSLVEEVRKEEREKITKCLVLLGKDEYIEVSKQKELHDLLFS